MENVQKLKTATIKSDGQLNILSQLINHSECIYI